MRAPPDCRPLRAVDDRSLRAQLQDVLGAGCRIFEIESDKQARVAQIAEFWHRLQSLGDVSPVSSSILQNVVTRIGTEHVPAPDHTDDEAVPSRHQTYRAFKKFAK